MDAATGIAPLAKLPLIASLQQRKCQAIFLAMLLLSSPILFSEGRREDIITPYYSSTLSPPKTNSFLLSVKQSSSAVSSTTSHRIASKHHLRFKKKLKNASPDATLSISQTLLQIRAGGGYNITHHITRVTKQTQHTSQQPSQPLLPPQRTILSTKRLPFFSRSDMYSTCITIVLIWILIGTLAYTYLNSWPLATSFFYAVDAGMSIGFCTDVAETTRISRAFSVLYILAGASVVAGALALFVEDTLEGASVAITSGYRSMLEKHEFARADLDRDGYLHYEELKEMFHMAGYDDLVSTDDEKMDIIWEFLDSNEKGLVSMKRLEQAGLFREDGVEDLLRDLNLQKKWRKKKRKTVGKQGKLSKKKNDDKNDVSLPASKSSNDHHFHRQKHQKLRRRILPRALREVGHHRLFLVFFSWIAVGVTWGMTNQKWDIITATHFAISALATGGLTAPPATEEGTLPNGVAIFVGWYCLFGIPLFYTAMAHFAKIMVQKHLVRADEIVIRTPLSPAEFEFAKHLCTYRDDLMHLSDFIVLYFLRRSKTNTETIELLRRQFELLDKDGDGALTVEEATAEIFLDDLNNEGGEK